MTTLIAPRGLLRLPGEFQLQDRRGGFGNTYFQDCGNERQWATDKIDRASRLLAPFPEEASRTMRVLYSAPNRCAKTEGARYPSETRQGFRLSRRQLTPRTAGSRMVRFSSAARAEGARLELVPVGMRTKVEAHDKCNHRRHKHEDSGPHALPIADSEMGDDCADEVED